MKLRLCMILTVAFCLVLLASGGAQARGVALVVKSCGKYLDVPSTDLGKDGVQLQIWSKSGKDNQRWELEARGGGSYRIKSVASGKCLDVANGDKKDGVKVQQWDCTDAPQQLWRLEDAGGGYYRLVCLDTGKCLDVKNKGDADGTKVQQWTCSGADNQLWRKEGM